MPSHRRRIRLTDRDAVYLAVATCILAITAAGSATATAPKPVELTPSVQPVPMTGHGTFPAPPGR